ncbi:MAG: ABC transporter permease subunit [Gammaproteobacteria bacterium]|nr:ABC transporter permease subunit [Gammaproteobacteria bacterium]NKB62975.1 ABC transporter permease subunit [Gammaproteobacteria bacterium]
MRNSERIIRAILIVYLAFIFIFIFTPIVTSIIFSFNSDRFPTLPLGSFTLKWYETIYSDPDVWEAARNSLIVAVSVGILSTIIGFCTAYTDFRYQFRFKNTYLALALLPPTVPLIILALAMLAWFSKIGVSGQLWTIILAHTVLCAPFAMAVIRLRLQQMDADLESAAWNLGASEWAAMKEVVIPFATPSIISALCLTMAVSFDEFAVAWFVSGLNKTIPVIILEILQGNIDPQINAIGTFVFFTSMTLVIIAQLFFSFRSPKTP